MTHELPDYIGKARAAHHEGRLGYWSHDHGTVEIDEISRKDDLGFPLGHFLHTAKDDGKDDTSTTPDTASTAPVLMYIHGGAFYMGYSEDHIGRLIPICKKLGVNCFVSKYRLTPEAKFPANVQDVVDGYQWLLNDKGIPGNKIVVWGDSAGGGLAVLLANALNGPAIFHPTNQDHTYLECSKKLPQPQALILGSPWLDYVQKKLPEEPYWSNERLFCDHNQTTKSISPVYLTPYEFPEILICIGSTENDLLDQCKRFSKSLDVENVKYDLNIYEKMTHCAYPEPTIKDEVILKSIAQCDADRQAFLERMFEVGQCKL